jgi:phosphoserine aminotransferase
MSRIFNFSAGPSTLPLEVLQQAQEEFVEFQGAGMSLLEMSHRSPEYSEVHERATALLGQLLGLSEEYTVLFLGGGATLQFSMIPMNLLHGKQTSCDFTVTGTWAKKAVADARKVGQVRVVFDGEADRYTHIPEPSELNLDPNASYLHITSNETIGGIQWHEWPDAGSVPIVADMSSEILSRTLPLERFGLIYAGAQKNLGPAGVALVIIRKDLLERCSTHLTAYLSYRIHAEKGSRYNTPPVYPIYICKLVLERLVALGGVEEMERRSDAKSSVLYGAIDGSGGFYRSPIPARCRSKMNVVWRLPSEALEQRFIAEAAENTLSGLKGHRSVGGCRASIYNAMPAEGVDALAQFMAEFARTQG